MLKSLSNNGMSEKRPPSSRDYIVITKTAFVTDGVRWEPRWMWNISRRSKPLGVRLHGENFLSQQAARAAGQKVLRELLAAIPKGE
ncbi:MAG TPA: hypothetical protein VHT68_10065 [Pseudolabrys sp.]|nr:hypothetical protein [Pseudolabrys sp.]